VPDTTQTPEEGSPPGTEPASPVLDAPEAEALNTLVAAVRPHQAAGIEAPGATAVPAGEIAFPRYDPARQTYDVYACLAGGTPRLVITEASQPDYLAGGSRLAIHSWRPDEKGLFVVDAAGGTRLWRITDEIEAARPSADFGDGAFVYHSRREADRQPRLYRTVGLAATPLQIEARVLAGRSPAWTPGGGIVYSGCAGDACGILWIDGEGGTPRQIVAGSSETAPEASPGGRYVAFMSRRNGDWDVYVTPLDGQGEAWRVTGAAPESAGANDGLPTWSPDGRWLAFVSDRDGAWAVWAVAIGREGGGVAGTPVRLCPIGGPLEGEVVGAAVHEVHGWVEERISWGTP
jgi:hypothetical protein